VDHGVLQSPNHASATDFAFIIDHTWTVPEQTKDNTISLGLYIYTGCDLALS